VEILAVAQVLPGPNVCNVALMIGDRFFGWRGALQPGRHDGGCRWSSC